MLKIKRLRDKESEDEDEKKGVDILKSLKSKLDNFDKKRVKEGKLTFIGIKPRVDTNRPLTKKEIFEAELKEKKMED